MVRKRSRKRPAAHINVVWMICGAIRRCGLPFCDKISAHAGILPYHLDDAAAPYAALHRRHGRRFAHKSHRSCHAVFDPACPARSPPRYPRQSCRCRTGFQPRRSICGCCTSQPFGSALSAAPCSGSAVARCRFCCRCCFKSALASARFNPGRQFSQTRKPGTRRSDPKFDVRHSRRRPAFSSQTHLRA